MFESEICTQNTAAGWSLFRHVLTLLSTSIFTDGRGRNRPPPPGVLSGWLYAFMAAVECVRLGALMAAAIKRVQVSHHCRLPSTFIYLMPAIRSRLQQYPPILLLFSILPCSPSPSSSSVRTRVKANARASTVFLNSLILLFVTHCHGNRVRATLEHTL